MNKIKKEMNDPLPIGQNDPILRELWAVKAKINQEADFKLKNLIALINQKHASHGSVAH